MSKFQPDWASPPGHSIYDGGYCAADLDMRQARFELLLEGKLPITFRLAVKLSAVWSSTQFWLNRERQYTEALVRLGRPRGEDWLPEED